MEVQLRTFKNRTLANFSPEDVPNLWHNGIWWGHVSAQLSLAPELQEKYPGFEVWKSGNLVPEKCAVLSKGIFVALVSGNFLSSNFQYKTVSVHPPKEVTPLGAVEVALEEYNVDISGLDDVIWAQIGNSRKSKHILLIKMTKVANPDFWVLKDDVTGDAYPYQVQRIFLLLRNPG